MDDRQRKLLSMMLQHDKRYKEDWEISIAIAEFANELAKETLANKIYLNGYLIYDKDKT